VRLYFCALLIFGGIIGMSFINSIFVDAMMSDNNDDLVAHIDEMRKSLDEMKKQLDALQKKD
jgi:voltage-gated sodium channel